MKDGDENHPEELKANGRYDRQLRLWGAFGQEYLNESVVICFGSSLDVQEALKNLVLPGVGKVILVDAPRLATKEDLAHSFLLGGQGEGRPRHEVVAEGLSKLNPSTDVHCLTMDDPMSYLKAILTLEDSSHSRRLSSFTLEEVLPLVIVGSDFATKARGLCAEMSLEQQIQAPKVIVMNCKFFYGSLAIFARGHYVIDDHGRDGTDHKFDLRIPEIRSKHEGIRDWLCKFTPEILEVAQNDGEVLAHIPWLNLLWRVDEVFYARYSRVPCRSDLAECRAILTELNPTPEEGLLNFQEANARLALLWQPDLSFLSPGLDEFLNGRGTATCSRTLIALKALTLFIENHGRYPITGRCPDMTSTTLLFNTLQSKYRDQAEWDLDQLHAYALASVPHHDAPIDAPKFKKFLKYIIPHLPHIVLDPLTPTFAPSSTPDMSSEDLADARRILTELEGDTDVRQCHLSGTLIGATASQEAVKLITHQWKPRVQDTIVWNGYNNMTYYINDTDL